MESPEGATEGAGVGFSIQFEVVKLPSSSDPAVALVLPSRCPKLLVPIAYLGGRFGFR